MTVLKIEPHVGIGPIRLGASRDEVRLALAAAGFPLERSRRAKDFFCGGSIQVEFDDAGNAHFIGISSDPAYTLTYFGSNVFDIPAPKLFELIAARDDSGLHTFQGTLYRFPNQIVTLWDADEQYDRLGGESRVIWAEVGLGNQIYLDAIRAIQTRNA